MDNSAVCNLIVGNYYYSVILRIHSYLNHKLAVCPILISVFTAER